MRDKSCTTVEDYLLMKQILLPVYAPLRHLAGNGCVLFDMQATNSLQYILETNHEDFMGGCFVSKNLDIDFSTIMTYFSI